MFQTALKYLNEGLSVIPILKGEKKPSISWEKYQNRKPGKDEVQKFFSSNNTNIGVVCGSVSGGLCVLDFDGIGWMETADNFIKTFRWIDETRKVWTGSDKLHLWVRCSDLPENLTRLVRSFDSSQVELRANRHYVLAPPSLHPSGKKYQFIDPAVPILQISKEQLNDMLVWFKSAASTDKYGEGDLTVGLPRQEITDDQRVNGAEHYLNQAIKNAKAGNRNYTGFWLACQLRDIAFTEDEAKPYMERYANAVPQEDQSYTVGEAVKTLQQAYKREPRDPAIPKGFRQEATQPFSQQTYLTLLGYPLTDAGNAESFKTLFEGRFCYVPQPGKWFNYDGVRWKEDDLSVRLAMLKTMRIRGMIGESIQDGEIRRKWIGWSLSSESLARIKSAITLSEPMIKINYTDFDRDAFLFCCGNGVVDLRTGQLKPASPEDKLHRSAGVRFDPNAKCPQWLNFLWEIFQGNEELIIFIQKAMGYTLTGDTSEQCFFILYGTGANGKSTYLGIFEDIMGEYGLTTPSSTFKERRGDDNIPNDIARMAGARFVKCIEVKESSRLNEERVKSLTGGDRIPARFLHQEFFDFDPVHKLWFAVNHKPIIRGTDSAIWRRIRLIPFEVTFPPEKQDRHLREKLQSELSGILNWAIKGCLKWQSDGLNPPEKVKDSTEEYRKESDVVGRFLEEKTELVPRDEVSAKELYGAYKEWCEENGEKAMTGTSFGKEMTRRDFKRVTKPYTHYVGLKLVTTIR